MAKNEFLPFANAANADVLSNAEYQALAARTLGFSTGVAKSKELNTAWRQSSVMSAALGQFIADNSGKDVLDNGDTNALANNLTTALNKRFLQSSNNFSEINSAGPVAISAALANLGLGDGSALPVGVPVPWPTAIAPAGWLKCNGASFDKTKYPQLALAYPSGVLPDLRGEFIRGWDDGRGVDSGRGLLSAQTGSKLRQCASTTSASATNGANIWDNLEFDQKETVTLYSTPTNPSGLPFQVGIVRPRNLAFNYIVRAA